MEQDDRRFPLAIVGMGCRFPGGAVDAETFWGMLAEGRSGVREVPPDRWDRERFYHPDRSIAQTMVTKWGGFVDGLDQFDAAFWGISPREAMRMDPQQRWLLEVAWEALEDSGTPPRKLRGTQVGVFVGIASNDYAALQVPFHETVDAYTNSGSTLSIASNRISYLLDLSGPSVSVDTACSSALVAVWMACESIWSGSATAALAGGVNALITPHASIGFSRASMLSPSGRCFTFDARANGYVRGEGAGMAYIKPLRQALSDRDRIYAVIRSAVCNQDGHTSSMSVPGVEGQAALLREAYRRAGVAPGRVVYMEAHGTGTPVGDPIEATALGRVLSEGRPAGQRCLVGSVKTNVGHLESGAGIVGLLKAALVLHKRAVPPSLNFQSPNPEIPFDRLRLEVATRLSPLPEQGGLAPVAAVNSFGFGGTNAHVVLEAAPPPIDAPPTPGEPARRPAVLAVSARDERALRGYAEAYRGLLADPALSLADVCCTAGERKEHHDRRLVVVANDARQMRRRLGAWLRGAGQVRGVATGRAAAAAAPLVFVFTGQGTQWWAMGRQLLEREPIFRRAVDEIDALFRERAGWSLTEQLRRPEETSEIPTRTDVAQPAIFAVQAALVELWRSWGIRPDKVIGHSVGEVAAAWCAGVYSLADAVHVIHDRSRLQQRVGGGRMLAVGVTEAEAIQVIGAESGRVHVGGVNSPSLVTLSGDAEPLEQIEARLRQAGRFTRWLRISFAFHSHQMDPIRDELLRALSDIRPQPSRLPFVSTVTGQEHRGEEMGAAYWWENVRQPVRFGPAICALLAREEHLFLEIGPHPALAGPLRECQEAQRRSAPVVHSLRRGADESEEILSGLAALHIASVPVDWKALSQGSERLGRLPSYPWSRERHWLEPEESARARLASPEHPLLGLRVPGVRPAWEGALDPRRLPYLAAHRIWDAVVFPAAGFAEIGLAVAQTLFPEEPRAVEDLELRRVLFLPEGQPTPLRIEFDPEESSFAVHSRRAETGGWELHACGRLVRSTPGETPPLDVATLRQRLTKRVDHDAFYAETAAKGYQFGPAFQQVSEVWRNPGEALAEVTVPEDLAESVAACRFHPAILDACFQAACGARETSAGASPEREMFLPQSVRRVRIHRAVDERRLLVHGRLVGEEGDAFVVDAQVLDGQGRRVADIAGLRVERLMRARGESGTEAVLYQPSWEPRPLRDASASGRGGMPPAPEMAAAGRAACVEGSARHDVEQYRHECRPRIDAMAVQMIEGAYADLGWTRRSGQRVRHESLCADLGIPERHRRLVRCHLRILAAAGALREDGAEGWEVLRPPQPADMDAGLKAFLRDFPNHSACAEVLEQTGGGLAAVLAGDIDPVELLFPGGSTRMLERFYAEAGEQPALHAAIAAMVSAAARACPDRAVRILEVGAGTGALSRLVLPTLPADRSEFIFSDIGPSFLAAARKQLAQHPFVEYLTLDLEKEPADQGLAPGSVDIVLASDVFHATSNLRQSLARLRACMAPGGLLLFLESTRPTPAIEGVIFGTLEGWWRVSDLELRPESPILSRDGWLKLLAGCGFTGATSFACTADDVEAELAVFVASVPGAVQASARTEPVLATGATYVLLTGADAAAGAFASALVRRGARAVTVRPGPLYRRLGDHEFAVPDGSEDGLRRVFSDLGLAPAAISGLIDFRGLDRPDADALGPEGLLDAQPHGAFAAFHLLRAMSPRPPRIWFVVRDLFPVGDADRCQGLASAPLTGLLRVANNEMHPCSFAVVDVGAGSDREVAERMLLEVAAGDGEREIAWRAGRRHAARLRRVTEREIPRRSRPARRSDGGPTPFRLEIASPGTLSDLALHEALRPDPGPRQVEVRVRAAGINFRDVMKALGTYPGRSVDALWLGDDFAGTIERVGAEVRGLKPGDEVAGMAPRALGSHVLADPALLWRKPTHISFEQAAGLPTVFLTAHYALEHLARLRPAEKILIHAAAGGVGQAAIQVARRLGLEVLATAGTPEKRQMLADMGVKHVMSSRTLEFADEVMELTGGRGVDAVLNSLAGDFISKGLSVLAPFGRFLEIGKVDVYRNSRIGLRQLRDNVSYFVIDLAQHLQHRPELVATLFAEIAGHFERGEYRPLPCTVFPVTQAAEAFRHMAQGKHVGKNVLTFHGVDALIGPCTDDRARLRRDGAYLVTGGAGGFCLEVARWMARQGAGALILMSRTGPQDAAAREAIQQMRSDGVQVTDARGDVTSAEDVRRVLREARLSMPPLRGVLHGAMVLDDEYLVDLDETRLRRVFEVKAAGAWNLHRETLSLPLEHFVCFSSVSCVVGAPRQAAYNAGNAFVDALAHYRRAHGLPALVVNWGAIAGTGYADRNRRTAEYLRKVGMPPMPLPEVLGLFSSLCALDPVQVVAARVDWQAIGQVFPAVASSPSLATLGRSGTGGGGVSLAARLAAVGPEARQGLVEQFIAGHVAGVFGIAAEKIDLEAPLTQLGLDSLMAIELKNRLEKQAGIALPMTEIMRGPSLRQLAIVVTENLRVDGAQAGKEPVPPTGPPPTVPSAPAGPQAEALIGKIDDMSEEQIDALLATVEDPAHVTDPGARSSPPATASEEPRHA